MNDLQLNLINSDLHDIYSAIMYVAGVLVSLTMIVAYKMWRNS